MVETYKSKVEQLERDVLRLTQEIKALTSQTELSEASALPLLGEVLAFLKMSRQSHNYCEDGWYSCPKAEDGCSNDAIGTDCNCGADKYNTELEILIEKIRKHFV